jgi:hypothetical protein
MGERIHRTKAGRRLARTRNQRNALFWNPEIG